MPSNECIEYWYASGYRWFVNKEPAVFYMNEGYIPGSSLWPSGRPAIRTPIEVHVQSRTWHRYYTARYGETERKQSRLDTLFSAWVDGLLSENNYWTYPIRAGEAEGYVVCSRPPAGFVGQFVPEPFAIVFPNFSMGPSSSYFQNWDLSATFWWPSMVRDE